MTNAKPSDFSSLFCIFNCMKIFLLFLTICFALANAQGINPSKDLKNIPEDKIQRTFKVSRDSLRKELWLEVEKNEIVKVCIDKKVKDWKTSLKSSIFNDSCFVLQLPTLIGVESINVYVHKSNKTHKINLAVGMKYLNFIFWNVFQIFTRIDALCIRKRKAYC